MPAAKSLPMKGLLVGLAPVTFVGVAPPLGLLALLACYMPVRRAMRAGPVLALGYEWGLGAGFVDHLFPDAFAFEDHFDELAGGTFSANGLGDIVGGSFDFAGGVPYGYG